MPTGGEQSAFWVSRDSNDAHWTEHYNFLIVEPSSSGEKNLERREPSKRPKSSALKRLIYESQLFEGFHYPLGMIASRIMSNYEVKVFVSIPLRALLNTNDFCLRAETVATRNGFSSSSTRRANFHFNDI
jgi:hypothetical protein